MRLTRIYVDRSLAEASDYVLTGATAHYLISVLRVHDRTALVLFNGQGGEFEAQVQGIRKASVHVRTGGYHAIERESPLKIVLGHSVCRGERSDYVMQKATELGVVRLDPLMAERTVVRLESGRAARRVAHWQSIAVQACEQGGRNRVPMVSAVQNVADWLTEQPENSLKLVLDTDASDSLQAIPKPSASTTVVVLVGPEGGFTLQELALAKAAGFSTITLGPRILRADTAAIAAVAGLQLQFGTFY